MRNLFLSIALLLIGVVCQAQGVSKAYPMYSDIPGKTAAQMLKDTIAGGGTAESQTVKIDGYHSNVSVQVNLKKLSGTLAGKLFLYGSLTGGKTATSAAQYEKVDSLTLGNYTSTFVKVFKVAPSNYVFYRIQMEPTGTNSTEFSSTAVARKP